VTSHLVDPVVLDDQLARAAAPRCLAALWRARSPCSRRSWT